MRKMEIYVIQMDFTVFGSDLPSVNNPRDEIPIVLCPELKVVWPRPKVVLVPPYQGKQSSKDKEPSI